VVNKVIFLKAEQLTIIRQCLDAVANGPFFPEWEFHALFGVDREIVKSMLDKWPQIDFNDLTVKLVINNSFNNLLGYPLIASEKLSKYITLPSKDLEEMFHEWRRDNFE
jgi:hypothetical protein